ncbi:MAG: sigma-70 family RNA polymerase sigma factor [Planctomycetota bacterium]|jgi:RNA polymerase sigma factor for flagellar operon FliA
MAPSARRAKKKKKKRKQPETERLDRDQLAEEYLPLVRHVVSRIASNLPAHVDTDELFQVGSVGLVNASRSFDKARGVAFKTYAFALIRGAILDELRRLDIVPRSTREKIRAMDAVTARLCQELDRPPVPVEVAAALEVPESAVLDLLRAARTVAMLSLDDGSSSPEALMVRDILPCPHTIDPSDAAAKAELIDVVAQRISELPDAERRVVTMYYREGLLLREIGAVLGVTESRVSQIHSRALARLQEMLLENRQP